MNNSSFVYNYISESNNAKISYCTSQTDRCSSNNILNNKIKVRKFIFIKLKILFYFGKYRVFGSHFLIFHKK